MKIDLHCHTRISDGSMDFTELVELALAEQVSHLAITNHDTTKGLEDMMEQSKRIGIHFIPGIEISAYDFSRNRRVHILGYYVKPGHAALEKLCNPIIEKRHEASCQAFQKIVEAGYDIRWEQVMKHAEGGTGVYKQHIMHALIDSGYTDTIYGPLYKKLFSKGGGEAEPGLAYVPMEYVDAASAIRAVRDAGGVPVLAHPGQYGNFEAIPELVVQGLQGIEVWHPLHGPEDEQRAKQFAEAYGLIKTGGSDFHGFYGEKAISLGCSAPEPETVQALMMKKEAMAG